MIADLLAWLFAKIDGVDWLERATGMTLVPGATNLAELSTGAMSSHSTSRGLGLTAMLPTGLAAAVCFTTVIWQRTARWVWVTWLYSNFWWKWTTDCLVGSEMVGPREQLMFAAL